MKTTAQLLERALEMHPAAYWHEKLALSKNALHAAKNRGSLSPALAGAIAEEMGESVKDLTEKKEDVDKCDQAS